MFIETVIVGVFRCNCTILACESTGQAVVIDPGDEPERILEVIRRRGLEVTAVLHTHAHLDHLMGSLAVVEATGAPARVHARDVRLWEEIPNVAEAFGIPAPKTPALAESLRDGETIQFGRELMEVIHTPGHTPGSCCFGVAASNGRHALLLSGDTLFRGSIGVKDPGKARHARTLEAATIVASIRRRLLVLDDATRVVPGHGPDTDIGIERRSNPFLCSLVEHER